jgi:hypothetical protein
MLLWLKEPPRPGVAGDVGLAGRLGGMRRGVGYIAANLRAYLPFLLVAAATSAGGYAMSTWSTSLWVRLHGFSASDAGKLVGLIGVVVGPLGTITGGFALDRLRANRIAGAPLIIMAGAAFAVVAIVAGFTWVSGTIPAIFFFALFIFNTFVTLPSVYAGMQMLTPDGFRGVAASFNMMIYTLCGLGLGPTAVGVVSDLIAGSHSLGIAVLAVEAALAAFIIPVAIVSRRSFESRAQSVLRMAS